MKYDGESRELIITVREFVSTARRGISTALPCNDDEPTMGTRAKKNGEGNVITHRFQAGEHRFKLDCPTDGTEGDSIRLTFFTDSSPRRPKRELVAQARGEGHVTAYALCEEKGLASAEIRYCYINADTGEENLVTERVTRKKLTSFFEKCKCAVSIYAVPEIERVTERMPSMKSVKFPYGKPRAGQAELVRSVYKNVARGGRLFAAAPTGTGKTVSVLFPAVRALGEGKCEKIFYFTPKTTTAEAACDCIFDLADAGAKIRSIVIPSKERACRNGLVCRENRLSCENSKCNKLSDAVLLLYKAERAVVGVEEIRAVSERLHVCPHELALSYAELCDVVICDINYLFDTTVYIRRFFDTGGNYAFLIDEAHNLPDRAREMYSAEISEEELITPAIDSVFGEHSPIREAAQSGANAFYDVLMPYVKDELTEGENGKCGAAHISEVPTPLYDIFDTLIASAEEAIYKNLAAVDNEKERRSRALRDYYYRLKNFRTAMGDFDSSYEFFIFADNNRLRAKCFCIDPGRQISRRLDKGGSATFFSGTLAPMYYYKSVLGGDGASEMLEVESPFESSQLSVSIMDKISTRLSERQDTLSAVCAVIAATVSARRGSYMIFSPSFAYSDALAGAFEAKYPKIKILRQRRDMSAREKREFFDSFKKKENASYLIGFCVMGGIYSEGIDLAGDSLIGAVIVGIGIPSLSYEREAICAYYNEKYDEGKQFAYIYPGMNRVLQAAGRVIRSEDDKGVVVLIDDRFDDPIYKTVIPALWSDMKFIATPKELREELDSFWRAE